MAKFRYHEGVGRATLMVNGKKVYVQHGDTVEVSKDDPTYQDLLKNRKWELLSKEELPKAAVSELKVENIKIEDLVAIKGVGKSSAEKVFKSLSEGISTEPTWNYLYSKGEQWLKDLLPDDIAQDIWNEVKKRGEQ